MRLSPQGLQTIEDMARRYFVSTDAVMTLLDAVNNGGGTMAQFSHPEFGGSGQWMQGGMTMVGDMFNNSLKAKVDNLCSELAGLLANQSYFVQPEQSHGGFASGSLFVEGGGNSWWPSDLGVPSSSGSQNNVRYAIFPFARRLAIEINGQVTVYDTLDHQIGGVSQQQGSGSSLTFSSQFGLVSLNNLPLIQPAGLAAPYFQPTPFEEPIQHISNVDEGDIFAKIERLAELRQRGILSDAEFSNKKAELLSRL